MVFIANARRISNYKMVSRAAGWLVLAIGALVLIGWLFDIGTLKSMLPALPSMRANTAVGFMLAGGVLAGFRADRAARGPRFLACLAALAVLLIGLLTLSEHLFDWNLRIDELLFKDPSMSALEHPGRMAPVTAFNFVLTGVALLLLLTCQGEAALITMQLLALTVALIKTLAVTAFIFNVQSLYKFHPYSAVALHTVAGFLALSLGVLLARPERGLMAVISSDDAGGTVARVLLPVALVAPIVLSWLSLFGVRYGWYDFNIAASLRNLSNIVLFAVIIWWAAASLGRSDAARREAEERLRQAHKALQNSNYYLRGIINGAIDPIAAIDRDLRYFAFNHGYQREFEASFGRRVELGMDVRESLNHLPAELARSMEAWRRALRGESFSTLRELTDTQGKPKVYEITYSPILGDADECLGASHIVRDITERRQAEVTLRQTAAELARSNAELEQFAYVSSHDLQEPLRAVAGCVQLLQRRYQAQMDERADELIRHAVDGAMRMQNLINDLLAYSRVGTRGRPFVPVDCAAVLREVKTNLEVALAESGAELSCDGLPTVEADPVQMGQLFQNLIGNAIKFRGPEPPRIQLGAERTGDEWLFRVHDNGIGIEPQYFERIFSVFQRLHSAREYPGTGIGLAICKKIVERHGGRIWVESTLGQGTTFCFTLPVRPALSGAPAAANGKAKGEN